MANRPVRACRPCRAGGITAGRPEGDRADAREPGRRGSRERENPTLDRFLEALEAVVDDLPGQLARQGQAETAQAAWGILAQVLVAATGYE
jgi:hypothetical protein